LHKNNNTKKNTREKITEKIEKRKEKRLTATHQGGLSCSQLVTLSPIKSNQIKSNQIKSNQCIIIP
jgi:hypothetical protein